MSVVNEIIIAREKVRPFLVDDLKWPDKLISRYGRVPVEVGASTVWADYVCYIYKNETFMPWLLVEVKKSEEDLDMGAVAQAESYSLILDCPFFCVTDGNIYNFFMSGAHQGDRTVILKPPFPDEKYLDHGLGDVYFPPRIEPIIESFVSAHTNQRHIRKDTESHERNAAEIRRRIFKRDIDLLTLKEFGEVLSENIMAKDINRDSLMKSDIRQVRRVMKFMRDFKKQDDPLIALEMMISNKKTGGQDLHLNGGGLFFITQLIAAAHPEDYVALEGNIAEALRDLGITSIFVQPKTANGYLFINDICKKLYKERLVLPLRKANLNYGLWAVHNFLWHYNAHFKHDNRSWTDKDA